MTDSELQHLQNLLHIKRRRLQVLEVQEAQFGLYVPPYIRIEIDDLRREIAAMERQLRDGGVLPRALDPEPSEAVPATPASTHRLVMSREQLGTLVNLLLEVPVVADSGSREAIVRQMPTRVQNTIVRHPTNRLVDVMNIVRASLNYDHGLDDLLAEVKMLDQGTHQMHEVDQFVDALRGAA